MVRKPQNATLTSNTDHSEAFKESSLPSLASMDIIAGTRGWKISGESHRNERQPQKL
jgi:hypothetical protein